MNASDQALSAADFERAMARFAPFEPSPRLALAVSGGADSMALAFLAAAWLRGRGGDGSALIVDHRLREGSAQEAVLVAERCGALGLRAEILTRTGAAPASAIEESARLARYELLEDACQRLGCLHLLTAHHEDDQSETVALRRASGSGTVGLAGMSACVERAGLRLLRPLLAVPKRRLVATARAAGLAWIEDPMNSDARFARARLRRCGLQRQPAFGSARAALESRLSAVLPRLAALDRFGVVHMDRAVWRALADDLRVLALRRIALAVAGGRYGPGSASLGGLGQRLDGPEPLRATLGGCIWHAGHAHVTVVRETRNLPEQVPLEPGVPLLWDGRFVLHAPAHGYGVAALGNLSVEPSACLPARRRALGLSAAAAAVLPAILDLEGLVGVPHLGYARSDRTLPVTVGLRPRHALSPVPFLAARDRVIGDEKGDGALLWA